MVGNQAVQRLLKHDEHDSTLEALTPAVSAKGIEGEDEPMAAGEKAMVQPRGSAIGAPPAGPAFTARVQERDTATALYLTQRQPVDAGAPAPPAPVVPPPPSVAAVNFLPTLMDQAPAGWGVTTEDAPVTDVGAFTSGANWMVKVTKADQQAHQGVRLVAGVVEVTAGLVAGEADCGKLKTMATSLNSVANQGAHSGFYMLSAVQAHENLHITQYRADLAPAYAAFRTTVEALTVPIAGAADAAAAKVAITALPAFTVATATFRAAHVTAQNKTASHPSMAAFNAAEHAVVDPMIATINTRRTALTCPP
jgi:hypothetical protein